MRNNEKTTPKTVSLKNYLIKKTSKAAEKEDVSFSHIVQRALLNYFAGESIK